MKNILFLCTGNSCRSQMAEGWCKRFHFDKFNIYSAGIEKHGLNDKAVHVMGEVGVDISQNYSKTIDDLKNIKFDIVFTVCDAADKTCPSFNGAKIVKMHFPDPPSLTKDLKCMDEVLDVYRDVRDQIMEFTKGIQKYLDDGQIEAK